MRETTFKILTQGDVQMAHCQGYMVAGGETGRAGGHDDRGGRGFESRHHNSCAHGVQPNTPHGTGKPAANRDPGRLRRQTDIALPTGGEW